MKGADGVVGKGGVEKLMRYCERAAIYTQLKRLNRVDSYNIYRYVLFKKVPWDYEKYGGLPTAEFLKVYPTDYVLTFDQSGCEAMSAFCVENVVNSHCQFPTTDMNMTCTSLITGNTRIEYCQKNCFKAKFPMDLYWDRATNSCRPTNLPKKIFCLNPHGDNKTPPLAWDQHSNTCNMTKDYCDYFGLSYDVNTGHCQLPKIQSFLEHYIFGKTIIRTLLHPTIVVAHAGDGKRIPYLCQKSDNVMSENISTYDIAKDIAVAAIPDIGLHVGNASLQYLLNFTRNLDAEIGNSIIMLEVNNIVREKLIANAANYLSKISKLALSPELFLVFVLGTILDVADNMDLNKSLTSDQFKVVMQKFEASFAKQLGFDAISPELILDLEVLQFKATHQIEKAYKLKYGGVGELLNVINIYTGAVDTTSLVYKPTYDHNFDSSRWPVRGLPLFIEICLLSVVSITSLLYSNTYLLIFAILLTLLLVLHLKMVSQWN